MSDETRLDTFRKMAAEFPDSPMAHFSLGRALVEARRYAEGAQALEVACQLDPEYAAALVTLGDAYAGAGRTEDARTTLTRARAVALAQKHPSLAEEIDERLEGL